MKDPRQQRQRWRRRKWLAVACTVGVVVGLALGHLIDNRWVALPVSLMVGLVFGDVTHHLVHSSEPDPDADGG